MSIKINTFHLIKSETKQINAIQGPSIAKIKKLTLNVV